MHTKTLTFKTEEMFEVRNITPLVEEFLKDGGALDGLVNVFTQHTTVAIKINEDGFSGDSINSEGQNPQATQMLIGSTSETIPVVNGKMRLGSLQSILMIELNTPQERRVVLSFVGNKKS